VTSVWNGIKDFFNGVWEAIKTIFTFAAQLAVGAVIGIFAVFGIDIVAVFTKIKLYFDIVWTAIKLVFSTALEWIRNTWNSVWGAIGSFIGPIWDTIKNTINDSWNFIIGKFSEFAEPLNKAWTSLWSGVGNTLTMVWEGVKTTIKNSINWILEKINSVIRAMNSVAEKGAGVLGMSALRIPEIPLLAAGGIVNSPTLAMIGEAGPEAVIPLSRMNGFGNGGPIINITISGNNISSAMDLKNICNKVEEALMSKVRRNAMV
jgi:phage-related protein